MPKQKPKTNVQLVTSMMNFSAYGPLAQMFIINAIMTAADATAEVDPASFPKDSWVHPESWVGVAKEIKEKIKANQ